MSRKSFIPKPVVQKPKKILPAHCCVVCREEPGVVELERWPGNWQPHCVPCGGAIQSVYRDAHGADVAVRSINPKAPVPVLPPPVVDRSKVLYREPVPEPVVKVPPKPVKPPKSVLIVPAEAEEGSTSLDDLLGI